MRVRVLPRNVEVECSPGELLSDVIRRAVPEFPTPCGGRGFCGKCAVRVIEGELTPPTGNELLHGLGDRVRLACQARVLSDLVVEIPSVGEFRALTSGVEPELADFSPLVTPISVSAGRPTISEPTPYDRAIVAATRAAGLKLRAARRLSSLRVAESSEVKVLLRGELVVDVLRPGDRVLGLAVDVGTTKIAAYLIDLEGGESLAEGYVLNPQGKYGDDVISRITHVMREPGRLAEMHEMTVEAIEGLAKRLCAEAGASVSDVHAACFVGNTVMLSILLGVDPTPIGRAPFAPYLSESVEGYCDELGFRSVGDAWFYVPPSITGFVGADAVADILTAELLKPPRPYLLLDIGTNTEIALATEEELAVASAPAGPALEGGNVSCGVKSLEGAVYRVEIRGGAVSYKAYGSEPLGLSGSGVISAVAELLRHGLLDRSGRMAEGLKGRFEIVPGKVCLTQRDVREVQKAKAAISSGWRILLEMAGLEASDLERVFICGSFGSNIDPRDALTLGLIPPVPLARVAVLGNSAGTGARLMLKSEEARGRAEEIARAAKFVELASHPEFMRVWLSSLSFGS
ncbi:MAG: hypothetical protein DRJ56_02190 [Thermoprotei archaeon]|nr:MAG: hypothetical protein DRJ56_02190 [Thermoprotei archaeon]